MKLTSRDRERFIRRLKCVAGAAVNFRIDQIRLPNGRKAEREYLSHPGAVGILAFPSPREILLIKQYRYPVHEFTYEIPAGKLAKGEDPGACVRRELEEEAGYRARRVEKLIRFWPTAAFSDEVLHLYYADSLVKTRVNPDEDEFLEVVTVSPERMERLIGSGQIRDSKTLIAFLAWKHLSKPTATHKANKGATWKSSRGSR
ncbi:MAG TPA: NUDIX hydrolase [Elusimicrobiota bacterium]|nr:NUDIX hydrolase [Elusimicrobiota bacterium]